MRGTDSMIADAQGLAATLQAGELARRGSLWRDADGRRVYVFDYVFGAATLMGVAAIFVGSQRFDPVAGEHVNDVVNCSDHHVRQRFRLSNAVALLDEAPQVFRV